MTFLNSDSKINDPDLNAPSPFGNSQKVLDEYEVPIEEIRKMYKAKDVSVKI